MNKPNFICGSYNVSPEHPSDWAVVPLQGIAKQTTLDGTGVKDVSWRKFSYKLIWEAMSLTDFNNLEDLVNYHNDSAVAVSFVYEKFRWSAVSILANIDPLQRTRKGGSGNSQYYQNVTITIEEVNPR